MKIRVGTLDELKAQGRLLAKVGGHGVCVFWHDGRAYALDDRCPHMGFPLHRGSVEDGLVTCHWHHARFDLCSGGTLDPFADDARAFPVEIGPQGEVVLVVEADRSQVDRLWSRLSEGLEGGLTLVTAKAVLGLLEAGVSVPEIVGRGLDFGTANRAEGWGSGLTVLVAMANLAPRLDPADVPLALVQGLTFLSRDTRNRPPRFPLPPLGAHSPPRDRLARWYRRFIETRAADSAERVLATALAAGLAEPDTAEMMFSAATDHVFLDVGHTLDFTNKAFEALDHVGWQGAPSVLPTLVAQTARASRSEEGGRWRHPHDLAGLVARTEERLPALLREGTARRGRFDDVSGLAWQLLAEEPDAVVQALCEALVAGADPEQLARALAYAAALRITRFHVQNDLGDWDSVHHAFTYANALHCAIGRSPTTEVLRGVVHGALRVYLDRFLNVPAARLPDVDGADLGELHACWDVQGAVDRAGGIVYGFLKAGGDRSRVVAALGHALLAEDAGFHWFQVVEAAARQAAAWPSGSDEAAMILAGSARFLAAHTPTRRELSQVVRTATRLRRGEDLFEDE